MTFPNASLPQAARNWLILTYLLAILPLYEQLQGSIYMLALLVIGWRLMIDYRGWRVPSRKLVHLFVLLGCALIVFFGIRQGLLSAMLNLLVLGCTLKFLESQSRRDLSFHVMSLFFLVGLALIYHQSLYFSLYAITLCVLIGAALLTLFQPADSAKAILARSGWLLLQSLPLMIALFLLLPKTGSLWHIPEGRQQSTGLSESLTPGQITALTRNSSLVFRAQFEGSLPPPQARYWRSLVHDDFDGLTWQVNPIIHYWQQKQKQKQFPRPLQNQIFWQGPGEIYTVYAEPSQKQWFYTLDYSYPNPDTGLLLTPSLTLWQPRPLMEKKAFRLTYYSEMELQRALSPEQKKIDLQIPPQINPQTRALVQQLQEQAEGNPVKLLALIENYYRQDQLQYTLQPPPMTDRNSIDTLLFEKKQGFCAHFASSLAFMLRVAGLPARVVSGYLGGEENQQGHYLSLYQFDAHAWVEVWINHRWQRVDPTLWVVPERLVRPLDDVLPESDGVRDRFSLTSYRHIFLAAQLHALLSELDYRWTTWVLQYDVRQQKQWLGGLLDNDWWGRLILLALGCTGGGILFWAGRQWSWRKQPVDPWHKQWMTVCQLASNQGIYHQPGETIHQFIKRFQSKYPQHAELMAQWLELLTKARYRQTSNDTELIATGWSYLKQLRQRLTKAQSSPTTGK